MFSRAMAHVLHAVAATVAVLCWGAAGIEGAAVPDSVARASLVWSDAKWAGELGSMPIGNGDVSSNVWVEEATGDLLFYAGKSDAFDANAQPIKVPFRLCLNLPLTALPTYTQLPVLCLCASATLTTAMNCNTCDSVPLIVWFRYQGRTRTGVDEPTVMGTAASATTQSVGPRSVRCGQIDHRVPKRFCKRPGHWEFRMASIQPHCVPRRSCSFLP